MTGQEWYEACSEVFVATSEQIKNAALEKKVKYRACQIEANRVWCKLNLYGYDDGKKVFSGMSESQKRQAYQQLEQACPVSWSMPLGGPYVFIVRELERRGGPSFSEKWLPAAGMLENSLQRTYPSCRSVRSKLGLSGDNECFEAWNKNIE